MNFRHLSAPNTKPHSYTRCISAQLWEAPTPVNCKLVLMPHCTKDCPPRTTVSTEFLQPPLIARLLLVTSACKLLPETQVWGTHRDQKQRGFYDLL